MPARHGGVLVSKANDYAAVDAQAFRELDKVRSVQELTAKATQVCENQGCAGKWSHTDLCNAAWILVMEAKRGDAA